MNTNLSQTIRIMSGMGTFNRFIKVPAVLSGLIGAASSWVIPFNWAISHHSDWLDAATFTALLAGSVMVGLMTSREVNHYLVRARLWRWGHEKFSSWEEFGIWINMTRSEVLEYVAQLPDEDWEPNMKRGGIIR